MNKIAFKYQRKCQCIIFTALAIFDFSVSKQAFAGSTITYGHFPETPGAPVFSYDTQGYRVWGSASTPQAYQMEINGHVAYTFFSGSEFSIIPSSLNAVIAITAPSPNIGSFAVPMAYGTQIGSEAMGYEWVTGPFGSEFTAARDGGIIGQPPLTIGYFTGLESAYVGLQFQMEGETYYGWARVGAPVVGINGGWIYDYAYQTIPNTPILAGQVPEPSIVALILVGGAALSFQRFRRDS